jgi:acyl-CoA reductase-like NAD-dependent aldehyde dehydrogenase
VDKAQYERVLNYIELGRREGATLLTGGKPCGQKGYYIEPAVFTNVKVEKKNPTTTHQQLHKMASSFTV